MILTPAMEVNPINIGRSYPGIDEPPPLLRTNTTILFILTSILDKTWDRFNELRLD